VRLEPLLLPSLVALGLFAACSAAGTDTTGTAPDGSAGTSAQGGTTGAGGNAACNTCLGTAYTPCDASGKPGQSMTCPGGCTPGLGCTDCSAGMNFCIGNDIHSCDPNGKAGGVVQSCAVDKGEVCSLGVCGDACTVALDQPSNIGCEFWSVDLDQQDALNDPASAPYGVVLANTSASPANVTVEINEAAPGQPVQTKVFGQLTVPPGKLQEINLGSRELDCGAKANDYMAPGTCLSSKAFRIVSSSPIVVYQFNTLKNSFSNDASLLLPTNALGKVYRVINWSAGHPAYVGFGPYIVDRSYVTIVGTKPNTQVTVKPTWKIKGNAPIAATLPGGTIQVTLGPFDVLNLETDDATLAEAMQPRVSDLTGTTVESSEPVAVFSGVESTSAPYGQTIPTYPGWDMKDTCCLDHLEEQLFPLESIGKTYVVTRSPVRSTSSYKEPDILRFVGAAATATVTTTLPAPFDSFTLKPGEVKDTWADKDIIVTSTEPVLIGQLQISQGYVDGPLLGDPSLTVFPPVEQYRTEYLFLTPGSWTKNYVVISAVKGTSVTIDGTKTDSGNCVVESAGMLNGSEYEARRCPVGEGAHALHGEGPFGIIAYGYGSAGSYAIAGGADVKRIYTVPPLQ
jgi:hypothetical protein